MPRTGRPPKHDDVIAQRPILDENRQPTGRTEPITRLQQIVGDVRIGLPVSRACKRAGIHRDTLDAWEGIAADVRARCANAVDEIELTDREQELLEFSDAVNGAELEWQTQQELILQGLGQGGLEIVEVVEITKGDKLIERRTTTKTTLPDGAAVRWRLKHKFPDQYSEKIVVAGEGEDGAIPIELRATQLGDALRSFLAGEEGDELPE